MYKLTYFSATNVIGFHGGLGRKHFVLDLTEFKDKDIIAICGDNATGKSTFLSLVHPSHTPSDDRSKFIIPGKEGSLIRVYTGDDGTVMTSKCIYSPVKDKDGHLAKCYLSMKRPGSDEEIELNPNGNVTSYNSLLYTYFGVNKDYLNFASYSDAVDGIVTMTGMERKNSVSSMIPNTGRFELAFNTINEKYKELRNLARNLSQKILALRDEDSLGADLRRVRNEIEDQQAIQDEYLTKLGKVEGRVKELSQGKDIHQMLDNYNTMITNLAKYDSDLDKLKRYLMRLYDELNLDYDSDSINFKGIDKISDHLNKYTQKIAKAEVNIVNYSNQIDKLRESIYNLDKELAEIDSVLLGLQTQDIDELEESKKNYLAQLKDMRYSKNKEKYNDMSYDGCVNLLRNVSTMDHMIQALYDSYGEMVSTYFGHYPNNESSVSNIEELHATIETSTARRDMIYRAMIEKEQYMKFQDILEQRPVNCKIDTCPFIANALKWQHVAGEVAELKEQYNAIGVEIAAHENQVKQYEAELNLRAVAQNLIDYIMNHASSLKLYLEVTPEEIFKSIANGTWGTVLDVIKLKNVAAILSEKDLYYTIINQRLPEIESAIKLAKMYGSNREMLLNRQRKLQASREDYVEELYTNKRKMVATDHNLESYRTKLRFWQEISDSVAQYKKLALERIDVANTAETRKNEITKIRELVEKCHGYEAKLKDARKRLEELMPLKQSIETNLCNVINLKAEKDMIDQDFMIVEIIRSIVQPGKGIRNELINIYMYDIYQIANELLLNTFEGRLYLKEFIITDKEFVIPYVYNGSEGSDISCASSSQQSTIAMALSLAIMSKLIDKYGVIAIDEADRTLSAENKAIFIDILTKQMRVIGISQSFVITHSPEYYMNIDNIGFIGFPGWKRTGLHSNEDDIIVV